jgi:hypothetical protein
MFIEKNGVSVPFCDWKFITIKNSNIMSSFSISNNREFFYFKFSLVYNFIVHWFWFKQYIL